MSAIEKRIAEAVALGVDHVRTMHITPAMAQECARRWLIEQARNAEREKARAAEDEAFRRRYADTKAEEGRQRESYASSRAWLKTQPDAAILTAYDERRFCERVYMGSSPEDVLADLVKMREAFERIDAQAATSLYGELSTIIRDGVDQIIEARAADLDMEWTATLLTTTVALPDGTRIEWGEATIAQHEARIEMLAKHAAGELETASRHRAAIDAIRAAGASCLNDIAHTAALTP